MTGKNWRKVFGNGALGKIFGLKKEEVTGECGRLHNLELKTFTLPQTVFA